MKHYALKSVFLVVSQQASTCLKSTIEILNNVGNLFKINNKATRKTSLTFWTDFTNSSSVSIVDF